MQTSIELAMLLLLWTLLLIIWVWATIIFVMLIHTVYTDRRKEKEPKLRPLKDSELGKKFIETDDDISD